MERIALDTLSLMSDGSWLHQFVNSSGQEVGSIAKHRDPNCLEVWKLLLAEEPFAKQELLLFRTTVNPSIEEGELIRVRAGSRPPDFVLLEGVNISEVVTEQVWRSLGLDQGNPFIKKLAFQPDSLERLWQLLSKKCPGLFYEPP